MPNDRTRGGKRRPVQKRFLQELARKPSDVTSEEAERSEVPLWTPGIFAMGLLEWLNQHAVPWRDSLDAEPLKLALAHIQAHGCEAGPQIGDRECGANHAVCVLGFALFYQHSPEHRLALGLRAKLREFERLLRDVEQLVQANSSIEGVPEWALGDPLWAKRTKALRAVVEGVFKGLRSSVKLIKLTEKAFPFVEDRFVPGRKGDLELASAQQALSIGGFEVGEIVEMLGDGSRPAGAEARARARIERLASPGKKDASSAAL